MPSLPIPKKKPWSADKVKHKRVKDMRWFYNSRKWRKFSKEYKQRNPLCIYCEQEGVVKSSAVTDHIDVYEVSPQGFDLDNLQDKYMQPLCKKHHNSKSGREAHGK